MTRTVTQILHASRKAQLLPATRNIPDRALTVILQANPAPRRVSLFQPYLHCAWTNKANLPCFSLLSWVEPGILNLFKSIKRDHSAVKQCISCVWNTSSSCIHGGLPVQSFPSESVRKVCHHCLPNFDIGSSLPLNQIRFYAKGGFLLFDPCS